MGSLLWSLATDLPAPPCTLRPCRLPARSPPGCTLGAAFFFIVNLQVPGANQNFSLTMHWALPHPRARLAAGALRGGRRVPRAAPQTHPADTQGGEPLRPGYTGVLYCSSIMVCTVLLGAVVVPLFFFFPLRAGRMGGEAQRGDHPSDHRWRSDAGVPPGARLPRGTVAPLLIHPCVVYKPVCMNALVGARTAAWDAPTALPLLLPCKGPTLAHCRLIHPPPPGASCPPLWCLMPLSGASSAMWTSAHHRWPMALSASFWGR